MRTFSSPYAVRRHSTTRRGLARMATEKQSDGIRRDIQPPTPVPTVQYSRKESQRRCRGSQQTRRAHTQRPDTKHADKMHTHTRHTKDRQQSRLIQRQGHQSNQGRVPFIHEHADINRQKKRGITLDSPNAWIDTKWIRSDKPVVQ